MSGEKISPLKLSITSLLIGAGNLTVFREALANGELLTAFIITISNVVVLAIACFGVYKVRQQQKEDSDTIDS